MTTAATFRAGGLASGMDTATIIEKLVQIESQPIEMLRSRQAAIKSQISVLGDLMSRLSSLSDAARSLATSGVISMAARSSNVAFAATPGPGAPEGTYSVGVSSLAAPAKARSQGFAAGETVTAGTLHLTVRGTTYDVTLAEGAGLTEVAAAINDSGAPVRAVVLNDGTSSYLSLTTRQTGYPIGDVAGSALSIGETSTGATGKPLSATIFQQASNAAFTVDGLPFEREGNTIADAVPGVTLELQGQTVTDETLTIGTDAEATKEALQKYVDAYNGVVSLVQKQLAVTEGTNRNFTLAGDTAIRNLQSTLQQLSSTQVNALGTVSTLADLGIKTARDGTLSIDEATLSAAVARDPAAVDALFSRASTGLADTIEAMVKQQTDSTTGILAGRKTSLDGQILRMDEEAEKLQLRLDAYQARLIQQFTAMENIISSLNATSNFLAQSATLNTSASGGKK